MHITSINMIIKTGTIKETKNELIIDFLVKLESN